MILFINLLITLCTLKVISLFFGNEIGFSVIGLSFILIKFIFNGTYKNKFINDYLDFVRSTWVIFGVVFLVRGLIFQPFIIPSDSMNPKIVAGDVVLVNQLLNKYDNGDVVVFHYPLNRSTYFIKRIIGKPGDELEITESNIKLNGKVISKKYFTEDIYVATQNNSEINKTKKIEKENVVVYNEILGKNEYNIYESKFKHKLYDVNALQPRALSNKNCDYTLSKMKCKLPEGYYFMMGDNRDHSGDSRYFGLVHKSDLVGKYLFTMFNF